jgi:ribosomal protein S18 acetylase RimI-like enzyme
VTESLRIAPAADDDIAALIALWQRCELTRPWNDPTADIGQARRGPNSDVLVGRLGSAVVASAMVGHDGHRGWFYYVAVDPDHRRHGFGRAITQGAETWLRERGIVKAQLMVRPENAKAQAFYERLGYDEQPRVIYAKWLDGREATP